MEFILKPENIITKKPYVTNMLIQPELASYFNNLNGMSMDGFGTVHLGGKIPKEVIPFIDAAFNCSSEIFKTPTNRKKI